MFTWLLLSIEPGYYKVGEFGIRHEDLVETIAVTRDTEHPKVSTYWTYFFIPIYLFIDLVQLGRNSTEDSDDSLFSKNYYNLEF